MEEAVVKHQSTLARWTARVSALANTPHALVALAVVAFIDGSVFPIPPFALLIPMVLARPQRGWFYAVVGTVASLLGGLAGYALGYAISNGLTSFLAIDPALPLHFKLFSWQVDTTLREVLTQNFWILAIACSIMPTPYKIVAIGSGLVGVGLPAFVMASVFGRTARFFGVTLALILFGVAAAKYVGQKDVAQKG
jgi:membrane protein YqaA with SNARE-associated domain